MHAIGGEKRQRVQVCKVDLSRKKISKAVIGDEGYWRAAPSRQRHVRCWEQPRRLLRGCSGWTSEPQRHRMRRNLTGKSEQSLRASSPAVCSSHHLLGIPHGPHDWVQGHLDRQLLPPTPKSRRASVCSDASVWLRKAAETKGMPG